MKKTIATISLLVSLVTALCAQAVQKVDPVFPAAVGGLIYLEGEDAVSTNFAKEPTLDYASSGLRVLTLNKDPQAVGAPFFAELAFVVEEGGDYEFWIGGTPPGPKDELSPSYVSPLQYHLDGGPAVPVYREDVQVVEGYSITNFWVLLKSRIKLSAGIHRLRVEVTEKRRYDNRYYFHLDSLFFLKSGTGELARDTLPAKFPLNRADRSLDNPYHTIAESETIIQQKPKQLGAYLELSKVYSLVSDYQSALKVLNRARINIGDDPAISLLLAKNRIWTGEFTEGLKLYREYLKAKPDDLAVWAEAAKVVAWIGQYQASLDLYQEALKVFPDELNLIVNNGLTMLWANRIKEGEAELGRAWAIAKLDPSIIKALGTIYLVNGYPQKAVDAYLNGSKLFPDNLELLLLLQDVALRQGQAKLAADAAQQIVQAFKSSDRLSAWLQAAALKATIKQTMLDGYQERLKANPDDLKLRDELVKAYFWNGRRDEAVKETQNILVNQLYRQFQSLDQELAASYRALETSYGLVAWLKSVPQSVKDRTAALQKSLDAWKALSAQVADLAKSGKTPDKLADAQAALAVATQALADETALAGQSKLLLAKGLDAAKAQLAGDQAEAVKALEDGKFLQNRKPWLWDRGNTLIELGEASARSNPLADYLLARIHLLEQAPATARPYLGRLAAVANQAPAFGALASQAAIWSGGPVAVDGLQVPPPAEPAVATDEALASARQALADLAGLPQQSVESRQALEKAIADLYQRMLARMQVQFWQYDLESADLRIQLADYHLSLERFAEARVQLERVLRVQPGNISAKFNLARAYQLSGDWSAAMQLYKEVYQTDPKFENTASLFNQLASIHASRVIATVLSVWDNARTSNKARVEMQAGGSTVLGFNAAYTMDTIRLIKAIIGRNNPEPLNDPVTINLHSLELQMPVKIPDSGLSFLVKLGGTAKNKYFESFFSSETIPASDQFFSNFVVSPMAGVGVNWTTGPLTLLGTYTFDQIQDSLFPKRTTSFEHLVELTANLFFSLPDSPLLQSVSSRTYAKAASVFSPFDPKTNLPYAGTAPQTNLLYTGVEELVFNLLLAKDPWTILVPTVRVSWEDSTNPAEVAYYAPNQSLNARGGLTLSSWIGLGTGWVLGLSLGGGADINDSPANTPQRTLFQYDGMFRAELSKKDMAIYLDLTGSRSIDVTVATPVEKYWSISLNVGLNVSLPDYIIP